MGTDTVLTEADVSTMINHAESQYQQLLVTLAFETGARLSELLALRITDIVLGDEIAVLTLAPTTDYERTIPLVRSVPLVADRLADQPDGEQPVFIPDAQGMRPRSRPEAVQRTLRTLGRKAGIDHLHAHQLRRAVRHQLLRDGISVPTVEWALGWQTTAPKDVDDQDTWVMFLELLERHH